MKTELRDILWKNSSTGETQIWVMNNHRVASRATVLGENGSAIFIGPPWSIVGAGDFNQNGKADILWYNSSTGETQIWFMDSHRVASRATVLGENGNAILIGPPWSIVGAGDFNQNGKADILWYNSSTGETQIWFMDNHRVASRATVLGENGNAILIGPPWSIVGAGDFNQNGKADILWYNSSTGETQIWFMDNHRVASRATVLGENGNAILIGPPWSIVGAGDFNQNGKADILWHNSSTGETQIWFMDSHKVASRATVLGENGSAIFIGPPWSIVGTGIFHFVLPQGLSEKPFVQTDWRYCQKCHSLFFNGFPDKGRCAVGGGHEATGYNFALPHGLSETPFAQTDWRYCQKCHSIFFNGYSDKGRCPVDGGHEAAGYNFVIPHDLPGTPTAQTDWRYCQKCHAMFFNGYPDKGRCPVGGGHEAAGYQFVLPHDLRPFVFTADIVTGGLAALGGSVTVTVNLDGSVRWQGHAHDSGADGYDFGISAHVRTPAGRAIALAHSGHVGGTFTPGSRDHDWDETSPPSILISKFVPDLNFGRLETHLEYSSDIGSTLESAISWLVKFGVGSLLAPVGAVVFVGIEVGSLISTGSLVPGARLVEGVLWMAGPGNTLFAIAAGGIASLGSHTRELTSKEYDWANTEVFLGSLPPRDRLVLTDTIGGGNRAFTFPRFDGKITLNMGDSGFADPRNYPVGKYGQTFIHELVHACQIQHTSMDVALLADAFASKVCEATGGNPYTYGPAGQAYSEFNLEQQAQIVSDWYAGYVPAGSNQTGIPKDMNSPYFRYIDENLRTGNL